MSGINGSQTNRLNRRTRRAILAKVRPRFRELAAAVAEKRREAVNRKPANEEEPEGGRDVRAPSNIEEDSTNREFEGGEFRGGPPDPEHI